MCVWIDLKRQRRHCGCGGVQLLRDHGHGIELAMAADYGNMVVQRECANLFTNFCKRIAPRGVNESGLDENNYDSVVTGRVGMELRAVSARRQQEGNLPEVLWGGTSIGTETIDSKEAVQELEIPSEWMEHVDALLWQNELVSLRLGRGARASNRWPAARARGAKQGTYSATLSSRATPGA
jgi:hypothetical protein